MTKLLLLTFKFKVYEVSSHNKHTKNQTFTKNSKQNKLMIQAS